jgi:hypothetical protein
LYWALNSTSSKAGIRILPIISTKVGVGESEMLSPQMKTNQIQTW